MRLLHSLSFRLTLIYAVLFVASFALAGGLYYWLAIERPMGAVRHGLEAERDVLVAHYRRDGAAALVPLLERRQRMPAERAAYHALLRPDGGVVTANLPSWPRTWSTDWLRVEADIAREGDEDEHEPILLDTQLGDGGRLLIGRDIEDLDELEDAVTAAVGWLLPALLLLGLTGGALMSLAIGRRLEAVSDAARRVIDGDLSGRIALRGTRDDFERLAETLNLMLARLEGSMEAVRRVSDAVAHELRTPLARLQATLQELEADPVRREALLGEAVAEADRLQAIFEAVLRISRIEAARYAGGTAEVDLSALLEDAVDYYQPEAEAREQRLETAIAPGLRIHGDCDLLFQATLNLIDNALKYSPRGGCVLVSGTEEAGSILFSVTDNGPGIPPELHEKVTERFFRAPEAASEPGLGLGLTLVSAVAAYHQSKLDFADAGPGLSVRWRFDRTARAQAL